MKSVFGNIRNVLSRFFNSDLSGSFLLLASVVIALVWANSPWKESYHGLWEHIVPFRFVGMGVRETLHVWVNDGLMAAFFFLIGLEIKREFLTGELASFNKAKLPIACAIGGMAVPALIYHFFNTGTPTANGWAIPMATDIAFALAILTVLGNRVPIALTIFLTALAVVDDLGSILVIAVYYTQEINVGALLKGLFFLLVLFVANRLKIRKPWFYLLISVFGVWLDFLHSGVHATIVGILVAFNTPMRSDIDDLTYLDGLTALTDRFKVTCSERAGRLLTSKEQIKVIEEIRDMSIAAESPLQRLEHNMGSFVTYFILPVFALSNAGITIDAEVFSNFGNSLTLGIVIGLLAGKFIGVVGTALLLVKLKWAELPKDTGWNHIIGIGFLAGIGFTMSIFITELALNGQSQINAAKLAVLMASAVAALLGYFILANSSENKGILKT